MRPSGGSEAPGCLARPLARWLAGASLLVGLACGADGAGVETAKRRPDLPNVLVVVLDTLRADRLSVYGNPRNTSPNLDAFAREGLLFENAYAPAPLTAPSHASLFTSTTPQTHGIWNVVPRPGGSELHPVLSPNSVTLAEVLRDAGFATAAFADGGWVISSRGFDQGFDVFESETRGTRHRVERALEWLDRRDRERPFFLFVHSYEVHAPYLPPPDYVDDFAADHHGPARNAFDRARAAVAERDVTNPLDLHREFFKPIQEGLDSEGTAFLMALYDSELRVLDEEIARLLAYLRLEGLLDDTLIVVTSDHGEEFAKHGAYQHRQVFAEIVNVPLLVRAPGVPRGARRSEAVELVDLMPSILAYLGLAAPDAVQGRVIDFRSTTQRLPERPIISEVNTPLRQVAVRARGLSAIFEGEELARARVFEQAGGEQRDVTSSPRGEAFLKEARALVARQAEAGARLRREHQLEPTLEGAEDIDAAELEQLRALGYVN